MADALRYVRTFIQDSLDSYFAVAYLHDYLLTKDVADELLVENYKEE